MLEASCWQNQVDNRFAADRDIWRVLHSHPICTEANELLLELNPDCFELGSVLNVPKFVFKR